MCSRLLPSILWSRERRHLLAVIAGSLVHRAGDLGFLMRFTPDMDFPLILVFQRAQTDYLDTEMGRLKIPFISDCWNLILGSIWKDSSCLRL